MRLIIDVDLGEVPPGLQIADAMWAIQKALEPVKQELLRGNDLEKIPKEGEILDGNNLDELIGTWSIQPYDVRKSVLDERHPMQQIYRDNQDTIRFRANKIVQYLFNTSRPEINMNSLAELAAKGRFSAEDQEQFAQLIGYSVSGFAELPYVNPETVKLADAVSELFFKSESEKTQP